MPPSDVLSGRIMSAAPSSPKVSKPVRLWAYSPKTKMNMLVDHIYTSKLGTQPDRFSNWRLPRKSSLWQTIDNQRNGLETQDKALMISVIRPTWYALFWNPVGSLWIYFRTLYLNIQKKTTVSTKLSTFQDKALMISVIRPSWYALFWNPVGSLWIYFRTLYLNIQKKDDRIYKTIKLFMQVKMAENHHWMFW